MGFNSVVFYWGNWGILINWVFLILRRDKISICLLVIINGVVD